MTRRPPLPTWDCAHCGAVVWWRGAPPACPDCGRVMVRREPGAEPPELEEWSMTWTVDEWDNCYGLAWSTEIVEAAVSHPAKYSRALIRRIYEHCVECGWLHENDRVLDPFGGVALGAYDALRLGLHWTGIELEPRFATLAQANIDLWNARYGKHFARWGTARILQGDSRRLAAIVGAAECAVSSPPYTGSMEASGGIDPSKSIYIGGPHSQMNNSDTRYGQSPGQLGAMKDTGFDAAIASPPFQAQSGGTNVTSASGPLSDPALIARHAAGNAAAKGYGDGAGQLANMAAGDWQAVVSSPPYAESMTQGNKPEGYDYTRYGGGGQLATSQRYGDTPGNIGNDTGDTFWSASRIILEQLFLVLSPGAHCCWVVKSFVRNGAIVDFPGQWRQLCESVGFVALHEHRASLVEDHGTQLAHDGNHKNRSVKRASFFRRLSEFNARASEFWPQVPRQAQAQFIAEAHRLVWANYHAQVAKHDPKHPARLPRRNRIVSNARALAYRAAGEPPIETAIEIKHETVYCMVRP